MELWLKLTVFVGMMALAFAATASPASASSICYQESTNTSTAGDGPCTLAYTGNYGTLGSWSNWAYTWDTNWGTYGAGSGIVEHRENYTKPTGAIGAVMAYKNGVGTYNRTIPADCWAFSTTKLSFFISVNSGGPVSRFTA